MDSTKLAELIACPIDKTRLTLVEKNENDAIFESVTGRRYHQANGCFYMIPSPIPFEDAKIKLWGHLQRNGAISYLLAPMLNLSVDNERAKAFGSFSKLEGQVLDIGCGPQVGRPAYVATAKSVDYVGLDPLAGEEKRAFSFVNALGEFLPFKEESFDRVLFGSSLDHMIDYKSALDEAARVCKSGGAIVLIIDHVDGDIQRQGNISRKLDILKRGISQFSVAIREMGPIAAGRYVWQIARLEIPDGALDYFHVYFPSPDETKEHLIQKGFSIENEIPIGAEVAIFARKMRG